MRIPEFLHGFSSRANSFRVWCGLTAPDSSPQLPVAALSTLTRREIQHSIA
jgi:hypothetical protein